MPLLNAAAVAGQAEIVRLLLAAGADPNVIGPYGSNALEAAQWGSVNVVDVAGQAAHSAIDIDQTRCAETVQLLFDAGANVLHGTAGSDEISALLAAHDGIE